MGESWAVSRNTDLGEILHQGNSFMFPVEGSILGIVEDEDGNPLAGAVVMLNNSASTTTGADGRFEFSGVTPGAYALTVAKDGYVTATQNVPAGAGEINDLGTLSLQAEEKDANASWPSGR